MRTVVDNLGQIGLIKDKEPTSLPPNAWTEMSNTRCIDRSIGSFEGYQSIATISALPETLVSVKTATRTFICYGAQTKLYSVSADEETEIGSGFSSGGFWDSCSLGQIGIFNNAVNNPQYWGGSGSTVDLPYDETGDTSCTWADQGMTARIIRAYRYHLFAFDIDDCQGRNQRKVWWSHPAEPGTIPITWDPTSPDYDAGFVELSDTPGSIIDAAPLRDSLQIYKDDAIYSATYTGRYSVNEPIWNFRLVTTTKGLYARNCVCDIGGRHFFVGDGDIYVYDGTNFQSIADERVKDEFFNNVSRTYYERCFAAYYHKTGEVWLCYPDQLQESCNKALVWDSNANTWSQRDIPDCSTAVFSIVDRRGEYTWETLPYATWDDWGITPSSPDWTQWDTPIDNAPIQDSLVLGSATKLYEMDFGNTADGSNIICYARRTHLDLGDKGDFHLVLTIYPRAEGDPFDVRVGSMAVSGGAVTWSDYQTFTPGTYYKLDFRVTGRLHAIEFYSNADVKWQVEAYEVDYARVGRR